MKTILTLLLISINLYTCALTCTSTGSGLWTNQSTWSCNQVPGCGDSIIIQSNHTVTIGVQLDFSGCASPTAIVVKGTMYFINGKKMDLPCNSRVYIYAGGKIDSDGSGNSNALAMCNITHWTGAVGAFNGPACIPSTLPNCATALPIELLSFLSRESINKVILEWSTATERNNEQFTIQRTSDGETWYDIGHVKSKADGGNSVQRLNYLYYDNNPVVGLNYYRLLQIDYDGTRAHSYIIAQEYNISSNYLITPNPSTGDIYISRSCKLIIRSYAGITVFSDQFSTAQLLRLDLPSGLYLCDVASDAGFETIKLIIE